ncbi:hypothetical protein [Frankia sp. AgPm24]|uniref:hypothetical protein n=1 Tax=Frankia sp. AgPm24 TaxID=631128 RepID=UPI00200DC3DE|nr:hypothetical protein [Frankia sp. AgPm24]
MTRTLKATEVRADLDFHPPRRPSGSSATGVMNLHCQPENLPMPWVSAVAPLLPETRRFHLAVPRILRFEYDFFSFAETLFGNA